VAEETFHIINFGCRATQADGAAIEQAFSDRHLNKAGAWKDSDVVVINTCTVTHSADSQAKQMIRRVHRENPGAKIVVTGCYAQRAPQELAQIDGVTCVVGNSHKEQLVPIVMRNYLSPTGLRVLQNSDPHGSCNHSDHRSGLGSTSAVSPGDGADVFCSSIFESRQLRSIAEMSGGGRTRPVLKVQDGCSLRCSYCVIPYVRGDSRSLTQEEVLRQVNHLLNQGFKEIVFTGIHLGAYGRDLKERNNLARVIRTVLQQEKLERLRLSSIEPLELTDEIIDLVADSAKMAKHFHVPLQSGADRILRLMRRPYTADYYRRLVMKLRERVPEAAIGADVMVGFPTETEADHEQTWDLLKNAPMTYLHVFPYSSRPGTPSANLKPEVPKEVAQQRSAALRFLAAEKNLQFRMSFLNRPLSVITLGQGEQDDNGQAISTNYLKVELSKAWVKPNQLMEVLVKGCTSDGVTAERLT
jgi:threonylcarbamoyladenosine tRNA methylthiotransferase MtaB